MTVQFHTQFNSKLSIFGIVLIWYKSSFENSAAFISKVGKGTEPVYQERQIRLSNLWAILSLLATPRKHLNPHLSKQPNFEFIHSILGMILPPGQFRVFWWVWVWWRPPRAGVMFTTSCCDSQSYTQGCPQTNHHIFVIFYDILQAQTISTEMGMMPVFVI